MVSGLLPQLNVCLILTDGVCCLNVSIGCGAARVQTCLAFWLCELVTRERLGGPWLLGRGTEWPQSVCRIVVSLVCQGQPFLLPLKQLVRPGPLLRDSSAISASLSCAGNALDTENSLVLLSCTELQQGCTLLVLWGMLCVSSTVAFLHSFFCSLCSCPFSQWRDRKSVV